MTTFYEVNIIHLIPKWLPINYSFVCMLISPLCLIFTSKFLFFIHDDEAKRANKHANKRIICWPPFWNKVYKHIGANFYPTIRLPYTSQFFLATITTETSSCVHCPTSGLISTMMEKKNMTLITLSKWLCSLHRP